MVQDKINCAFFINGSKHMVQDKINCAQILAQTHKVGWINYLFLKGMD
jgi:hypothetical protein